MKIYLGSDHAGFELKGKIKGWLSEWGYEIEDKGADALNSDDDFNNFVRPVAEAVAYDPQNVRGIVLGGSGQGEAMQANRVKGVRAAVYYGPSCAKASEGHGLDIVRLSREHNDANVLSLGARFVNEEDAKEAIELWLKTPRSAKERYQRRNEKLDE
jgi:ribose 5-phosphate isomerase B